MNIIVSHLIDGSLGRVQAIFRVLPPKYTVGKLNITVYRNHRHRAGMELMDELIESVLKEKMEELKLEYLNTMSRIIFTRDVQNLTIGGQVIENAKKGDVMYVKRWIGEALVNLNLAEWVDKGINMQQLLQIEWRERNNLQDLQPIPRYFYIESMWSVEKTKDARITEKVRDILKLRMAKIVQHATKGMKSEVVKKLTPEEEILYNYVMVFSSKWEKLTFSYEGNKI